MIKPPFQTQLNVLYRQVGEQLRQIETLEAKVKKLEGGESCAQSDMSDSQQVLEQPSTTIPLVHLSPGTMLMGHYPAEGDSLDKWLLSQAVKESYRSPVKRALLNLREHYLQLARHGCSITDGRESG